MENVLCEYQTGCHTQYISSHVAFDIPYYRDMLNHLIDL